MWPETILSLHNYYQQPGGEDRVFAAEARLLEHHGHRVIRHTAHNNDIAHMSRLALLRAALWNSQEQRRLQAVIQHERPHLAHIHNTFVLFSPAIYATCQEHGLPVVQTLHNYRLVCPDALLFRDGHTCNDCLGKKVAWPGVLHACYHHSRLQTATIAAMLALHHARGTWHTQVNRYIALSEFARQTFIAGGLPAERIVVKPNFVDPDPGMRSDSGSYALVVGRLSPEKGIITLLRAWASGLSVPLKIAGDGPLMAEAAALVNRYGLKRVHLLGQRPHSDIIALLKGARLLVFPSECYENFALTLVEAFACGVPVVASGLGSTAEIVTHGYTGLLVQPGSPADLAAKVNWLWSRPAVAAAMGNNARAEFEAHYTAERNYARLREIYAAARVG